MDYCCVCGIFLIAMGTFTTAQKYASMENVAQGKPCRMSTQYSEPEHKNDCNCSCVVNGKTWIPFADGNCIHTDLNDTTPSWSVDLGRVYTVRRITIYARPYENQLRMRNVTVLLDNNLVYRFPMRDILWKTDIVTSQRGRYVTVSRAPGTDDYEDYGFTLLNLCEVQVWVCRRGFYGEACREGCRSECSQSYCDDAVFPNTCPGSRPCNKSPCGKNGQCEYSAGGDPHRYSCRCWTGYTGQHCEQDVDECLAAPCQNGGSCLNVEGSYFCFCPQDHTGARCGTALTPAHTEQSVFFGVGAAVGVGFAALIIAVAAVIILFVLRNRRRVKGSPVKAITWRQMRGIANTPVRGNYADAPVGDPIVNSLEQNISVQWVKVPDEHYMPDILADRR